VRLGRTLSVACVLALAACGGSSDGEVADAADPAQQTSAAPRAEPAPRERAPGSPQRTPEGTSEGTPEVTVGPPSPTAAGGPPDVPDDDEPTVRGGGDDDRAGSDPLRDRIDAMSVRDLAHRLLVVTVAGTSPTEVTAGQAAANQADFGVRTPAAVARTFQPGGVVYFDANVRSVPQVRRLSRGLHAASTRGGTPTLLFTDQEGGSVSRLPGAAATSQPAARDFGGDPELGLATARQVGTEMAAMGLDVDFAPVADVDSVGGAGVIGNRAFGTDADVVGPMVRAQTCGYHQGGVGVTVKHWPGHGSTSIDSHEALPTLTLGRAAWRREHLPPFVAGIRAGADLVMTGHLAYPSLDPTGRPATLSRRLTHGWLRERLGFDGVVVTDSLEMAAIADRGTSGEVAVSALRAGADLLLMPPSPQGAASGIQAAVTDGRLSRARLEASVLRVLELEDSVGLVPGPRVLDRC